MQKTIECSEFVKGQLHLKIHLSIVNLIEMMKMPLNKKYYYVWTEAFYSL